MPKWLSPFDNFLNPKRIRYAFIAGAAIWTVWLVSIMSGPGNRDLADQVIGTDYIQFYSAGKTLLMGEPARLYDFQYQHQLEEEIAGELGEAHYTFLNPPFHAWIFLPFATLPYSWSFLAWSLFSLLCLWTGIRLLQVDRPVKVFLYALTFFPVFASISYGQNGIISFLLLCITYYFWIKERDFLAGVVCSLMLFKPQLILGISLLWLLDLRNSWRALIGLGIGALITFLLSWWILPNASLDYIFIAREILPNLLQAEGFPLWHAQTVRSFLLLVFSDQKYLVEILNLIVVLVALLLFFRFFHRYRLHRPLLFASAIVISLIIAPHVMIYDWVLLIIPAIILWKFLPQERDLWKVLFAVVWVASFISDSFTFVQLGFLPFAIQLSVPILILTAYGIYRKLNTVVVDELVSPTI